MTNKFHINSKGIPAVCKADQGNCPFGGLDSHYYSIDEAQKIADELGKQKYGLLANSDIEDNSPIYTISTSSPSQELLTYIDEFTKTTRNIQDYQDFYDKVLEHDNFDDFASQYAGDVMEHPNFKDDEDVYSSAMNMWKEIHYHNSSKDLNKISDEEAIQVVQDNLRAGHLTGWFREYDSDYKPGIEEALITNQKLRNASMNIAHRVYQESTGELVDFDEFLEMEIEVHRGGNFNFIDSDVFVSYSFDEKIAEKFCTKENPEILTRKIKMKDTLGSLQTTGEAEVMVSRHT